MSSLTFLYLDHNELTSIDPATFSNVNPMDRRTLSVYLNDNPIQNKTRALCGTYNLCSIFWQADVTYDYTL